MIPPMRKLAALIVDDERLARQRIHRLLLQESDIEVVGQCASAQQAQEVISRGMPDLLFLDIEMPRVGGFELLKLLKDKGSVAVIFVTAYEQYAVRAFDIQACDYLLKPVEDTRLRVAVGRAREMLTGCDTRDSSAQFPDSAADSLLIRSGAKISRLPIDAIDWIESAGNYVYLHSGGKSHLLRESIMAFEAALPRSRFARIHRTTIVNLHRVLEFHDSFHGDFFVLLQGGRQLRMSRTYRNRVRDLFGKSI